MEPGKDIEDLSGKVEHVEQKLDTHINDNERHLTPPPPPVVKAVEPGDVAKAKKKGSLFGDPILVIE